jgi:hypothetical protein
LSGAAPGKLMNRFLLAILLFLAACAPAAAPTGTPVVVRVYATASTQPWLAQAYKCAESQQVILSNVLDPQQADISLRLGEPERLASPAYQIGQDDLLVVTRSDGPLQNLTTLETQELFSHPNTQAVQVWVFASGEDLQQVFTREVLGDQIVTSLARAAVSPQQMSDALNQDKTAVGILPRHSLTGALRAVFSLPNVPVLALTPAEPQGPIKALLACLQK